MRLTLKAAFATAGLLVPAAAVAAPATLTSTPSLGGQSPLTLVRDGEEYSGVYRRNYGGRWGYWDNRYGYGPYYGYRARPYEYGPYYGYRRYYRPGFGFGLSPYPYPYYHGPSFGVYVNP